MNKHKDVVHASFDITSVKLPKIYNFNLEIPKIATVVEPTYLKLSIEQIKSMSDEELLKTLNAENSKRTGSGLTFDIRAIYTTVIRVI